MSTAARWSVVSMLLLCLLLCAAPATCDYVLLSEQEPFPSYGHELLLSRVSNSSSYPGEVELLSMSVYYETPYRIRVLIRDASQPRWEVPDDIRAVPTSPPSSPPSPQLYRFSEEDSDGRFGFSILRSDTSQKLFNTRSQPLVFSDRYLQLTTALPSPHFLYGLGERNSSLRLPPSSYTLWNADNYTQPQLNMYGSHPAFYSLNPDDASAHAVVLLNSNMMQVDVTPTSLTYHLTGGVIDLYFLLGPTPHDVADQYTELVGRPFLPPLWALGFHTCRWGLSDVGYTRAVVDGYLQEGIPLDAVWHDIDYMQLYFDFTFDPTRYATTDLAAFNAFLTAHQLHHVYIVDPGIPALHSLPDHSAYLPYTQGKESGVFIRHPANDSLLYACVWPSVPVVFPDFTHPSTLAWWMAQIAQWSAATGLPSGLWLDMNEPSSFVHGQLPFGNVSCLPFGFQGPDWSNVSLADNDTQAAVREGVDVAAVGHPPTSSPWDIPSLPFLPGGLDPNLKSINISSIQHLSQSFNLHNLFGLYEQRTTRMALEQLQGGTTRSFTLSRATFLGSGREGASWTGDHDGGWEDLKVQTRMFMQMGLHGVNIIGSDLCGLGALPPGPQAAEACARWIQLGALSPFARMHYQEWNETAHREPYALPEPAKSMSRSALLLRLSLLLYLNALAVDSHLHGRPLWRPMWFDFVDDRGTWTMDQQAMIGPDLLFPPVTDAGVDSVTAYIPAGDWYDFHTHARVSPPFSPFRGSVITVPAPYTVNASTPLLMRGGRIVVTQTPGLTTAATHPNPLQLHIALNASGQASGYTYLDDGVSLTAIDSGDYQRITFTAAFNLSSPTLQGLLNITGYNDSATGFNISGYSVERVIIKGVGQRGVGGVNVTVGGVGGEGCVTLNTTAVRYEEHATVVEEGTGLLRLTGPLFIAFNDGCVLPAVDEENFSLLGPIIVLVLLFGLVVAVLVALRMHKHRLANPPPPPPPPAVQPPPLKGVTVIPTATRLPGPAITPSAGTGSDPADYAVGPDGAVVKKRRKGLKKGGRTPRKTPRAAAAAAAAEAGGLNDLQEGLMDGSRERQERAVV